MKEVDVRNLACPGPVLKLRDMLADGDRRISMHVADTTCRTNVTRFAQARGAEVAVEEPGDGSFIVTITADDEAAAARSGEEAFLTADSHAASEGPIVVQITARTMGSGDDELGALLLRSFLKTQIELERHPDAVIFYNEGVTLCCTGSPLVEDVRSLEEAGIDVIACGTCLNFFGLSDHLEVGRVTDMLEIATLLAEAGATIRP
ncbi:MAG: sulfurtransferase-like selenium metabolism protein YedF [Holophagae bacterium]|jgi:selenium metabolism protein YedF